MLIAEMKLSGDLWCRHPGRRSAGRELWLYVSGRAQLVVAQSVQLAGELQQGEGEREISGLATTSSDGTGEQKGESPPVLQQSLSLRWPSKQVKAKDEEARARRSAPRQFSALLPFLLLACQFYFASTCPSLLLHESASSASGDPSATSSSPTSRERRCPLMPSRGSRR